MTIAWDNYYNSLAIKSMEPGVKPTVECRFCGQVVEESAIVTCIACGRQACRECMAETEGGDWYCREVAECERYATEGLYGEA